jgi:cyanophycinase
MFMKFKPSRPALQAAPKPPVNRPTPLPTPVRAPFQAQAQAQALAPAQSERRAAAGRVGPARWPLAKAVWSVCGALGWGLAQAQTAVVAGGALKFDNVEVWQRIVSEAGGPGARIAVFANAAGNPERSGAQIVQALSQQGALAELIPVAPKMKGTDWKRNLQDPVWIDKVRQSQGVFFSGGAQELIVDSLAPEGQASEMLKAIWAVYQGGGVVAGTSAGAAIMSTVMFRDAQDVMRVLRGPASQALRQGREIDRGLGFVGPELFIDQHFLKRGRLGRMLPLMHHQGYRLGLGVEENSAAVIKQKSLEVIGARGVLVVDLSQARHDARMPAFNLSGVRLSYLERGDRHDFATGQSTASATKLKSPLIDPQAPDFRPSFTRKPFFMDILGDNTLVQAMAQLVDGPAPELKGLAVDARSDERFTQPAAPDADRPQLGFEFRLYRTPASRAWFTSAWGGEDYTVLQVGLDVVPVEISLPLYRPLAPSPATHKGSQP